MTSTVSTAAAIQTPATTGKAVVSTVYVTVGSGSTSSVITNTVTASEVVAQETVTLTMTGSAGVETTYTMTVSQAATVTNSGRPQITARPGNGNSGAAGGNQCAAASTVTLISVSTVCGTACPAAATGFRFI